MRPRGAAGTGKDTDEVPTGCPRGAHGVPLVLPLRGGGWLDGWMDGRATPLQPLLGELAASFWPAGGNAGSTSVPAAASPSPARVRAGLVLPAASPRLLCPKKRKQKAPTHPLFPLCWEMGAPGLAARRLWGDFRQNRGEFGCQGPGKAGARPRARSSAGQWGGRELQIQQSPRELSAGKTCKRIEFSRCARSCRWQRHPRGEAPRSAPCQASQGCSHHPSRRSRGLPGPARVKKPDGVVISRLWEGWKLGMRQKIVVFLSVHVNCS